MGDRIRDSDVVPEYIPEHPFHFISGSKQRVYEVLDCERAVWARQPRARDVRVSVALGYASLVPGFHVVVPSRARTRALHVERADASQLGRLVRVLLAHPRHALVDCVSRRLRYWLQCCRKHFVGHVLFAAYLHRVSVSSAYANLASECLVQQFHSYHKVHSRTSNDSHSVCVKHLAVLRLPLLPVVSSCYGCLVNHKLAFLALV